MSEKAILWDFLLSEGIATQKELELVTCINGYNIETLNSVLYARANYRDLEQFKEAQQ